MTPALLKLDYNWPRSLPFVPSKCAQNVAHLIVQLAGVDEDPEQPSKAPSPPQYHPDLTLVENLLLEHAAQTPIWQFGPTEPDLMFAHCQMSRPLPETPSSPTLHQTPHMTASKAARMCLLAQSCASLHSVSRRILDTGTELIKCPSYENAASPHDLEEHERAGLQPSESCRATTSIELQPVRSAKTQASADCNMPLDHQQPEGICSLCP